MSDKKAVYGAITFVMAKLAKEGISKDRKNQQQGYSFRGIDDVYNALAPFLAEAKLCILPKVEQRECVERRSQKDQALFYVTVKVDFAFVSAEDGSEHHVVTYGEAMDSGDKATNKAMSAAYKYACMQAFCIPTEGDNDADAKTHVIKPSAGVEDRVAPERKEALERVYSTILDCLEADMPREAVKAAEALTDPDEKVFVWDKLGSKQRSLIKRTKQEMALEGK